jgi:hypothetical protein
MSALISLSNCPTDWFAESLALVPAAPDAPAGPEDPEGAFMGS